MFSSAWSLSFALAGTVVAVGIIMMPFALLVVAGILRQRRSPASSLACFFLPIWRLALLNRSNLRDHRKIAVFDGERVFAGGRNLADEYLGPKPDAQRWADFSFVLEGPAALHYGQIFRYDWAFASREQLPP